MSNDVALDWVDQNSATCDEKVVFEESDDHLFASSDEDKILWSALTKPKTRYVRLKNELPTKWGTAK